MRHPQRQLARSAPNVATQLDVLRAAIDNLGAEIGAALAAQAEQQTTERAPEPEPQRPTVIEEAAASPTKCYRARQTAARLDVHPQTLWRWIREGRFPQGIRIGEARVIWTEEMLARWLAEKQANPGEKRRVLPRDRLR